LLNKTLYIVGLILLLVLGYAVYEFSVFSNQRTQEMHDKASQTTKQLRDEIGTLLTRVTNEGQRLATLFGENDYSADDIRALLKESSLSIPEIQGVTAAFEPFAFNKETRLFAPYYDKGSEKFVQVEESYDYSEDGKKETAWYTEVRDKGTRWVEPYFGTAIKEWYVDLGVPFSYVGGKNKGKVRGTITVSFLCRDFGELIHQLSLGRTGYGIITSPKGVFLAHPDPDLIGRTSLDDWVKENDPPSRLVDACEALQNGESGLADFQRKEQKDNALFCYDQIDRSKWGIGMMFLESDLLGDPTGVNRRYINISILSSLLLVCVLAIVYSFDDLDRREIWRLSVISSALLLVNVFLIGWLKHQTEDSKSENVSYPIADYASLDRFVRKQHRVNRELKAPRLIPIPTGIHVQRMDFQDSYNLNVGGTIWQKIPVEHAGKIEPGILFPQTSPFAEASLIEEAYSKMLESKEGEDEFLLVGWNYRVTLQLNFEYANFPFDKRQIDIEIAPADNSGKFLLVPDLSSYRQTTPSSLPAVTDSIVLSGNEMTESYFNFSTQETNTNFGFGSEAGQAQAPLLHFNIHLRRKLLNVFVTYLIPIVVALVMIFILLIACRKTTERQGIIESMAAFIFVLIFSHIDLRKEVVTGELIYLEYFYFITYAMVLLTTFNLMAYTLNKTKAFDFNDNQIFKAIYFPLFLFAVLIVTVVKFY
jgi:hypothetical protein